MADVLTNEGAVFSLDAWKSNAAMGWKWVLFQNNVVPVAGSVWANFTEATFAGYQRQNVAFPASVVAAGGGAQSTHPAVVFACAGGGVQNSVWGYALIDTMTLKTIFAAQLPGAPPKLMANNGDTITLNSVATLVQG